MTKQQKSMAENYLREWWEENQDNPKRYRDMIGRMIRQIVTDTGNWKAAPRGNPRAGYRAMQATRSPDW